MKNNRSVVKKITAVVLSAAALLVIAVPHNASKEQMNNLLLAEHSNFTAVAAEADEQIDKTSMRWVSSYGNLRLDVPNEHLDPEEIMNKLEFDESMLSNEYRLMEVSRYPKDESDNTGKNFFSEHKAIDVKSMFDKPMQLTYMPVYFAAGDAVSYGETQVELMSETGSTYSIYGELSVSGNQIIIKPDESKGWYPIKDVPELVYDFSLKGTVLTLSHEGESVDLEIPAFSGKDDWTSLYIRRSAEKSERIDDIEAISISKSTTGRYPYFQIYLENSDDPIKNVAGYFYKNGLFNFSWSDADGTVHAYEYAYIVVNIDGMNSGLILTDGTNVYRYTSKVS